jgi:Uma2 family endonuclease
MLQSSGGNGTGVKPGEAFLREKAMAIQFRPLTIPTDEDLEYLNARNAPLRFERSLDGDLVVTPPTGYVTGRQNSELVRQLGNWNLEHGHGAVLESSTGVTIGLLRGAPDAGWLSGDRDRAIPKDERRRFLAVAPELVFELMSPGDTKAATAKRADEWVSAGVRLAVVLDPDLRVATPHDKNGAGLPVFPVLRVGKALLPGADTDLELDLAAIFDAAD